jgi:Spy/CpxP family protein refolding chaperone
MGGGNMQMLCLWLVAMVAPAHAAPPDPSELARRMDGAFEQLDTTPAQRAALRRVAEAAWEDLDGTTLPAAHQLAQEMIGVLSSARIDKRALETARQGAVELFDQTTSELLPRAVQAAEILTPEQRQRAASLLQEEVARWLGAAAS